MTSLTARMDAIRALGPAQWLEWANRRLPPVVTVVLLIVLAWQLAQLFWLLWPAGADDPMPQRAATPGGLAAPGGENDPAAIARRIADKRIFGAFAVPTTSESVVAPVSDDVEVVEDSEVKVVGMGASIDDALAFAIVEDRRKEQSVHFVGDQLPNDAELVRVDPDGIVIRRPSGDTVKLTMPRVSAGDPGGASVSASRTPTRQSSVASNIRQEMQNNPVKFTDIVRPQPVFADGKQRGYRVYPGRDRKKFTELGLKPGDLITEINGTSLNDPAASAEILRALTDATNVSLSLERNGQVEVLNISLN